jgi:hypothetical protein
MSRSGYSEECENWDLIRWRGAVKSAIKGKRGQQLLRELLAALDSMPEKRLITEELEANGEVCALGCLGRAKGVDLTDMDPTDSEYVAATFGIAPALAKEIVYENDEGGWRETPEERWTRMRKWVSQSIKDAAIK